MILRVRGSGVFRVAKTPHGVLLRKREVEMSCCGRDDKLKACR